jgi:hypothetical protein
VARVVSVSVLMRHAAVRGIAGFVLAAALGILTADGAEAQPNVTGQWSTMSALAPVSPIHVALMRTGKVLMIEGSSSDPTQTVYRYAIWNPATGSFTMGTTPWDLFCNSMSFFPDGRLLISGGNRTYNPYTGLRTTTIFDPATEKFIQVEDTAKGRWYPTTVMLQDGGVMSFSGLDESAAPNPDTEIYDVGHGWSGPYVAPFEPKYYPRLHLLKDGKVLMTGPDPAARTFNPATGTWSSVISNHPSPDSRMYGTSVMLPLKPQDGYAMRFLATGGNTSSAYGGAHILDTSLPAWSWRAVPSLDQPRVTHSAVLLPNGKVLHVGGSSTFNVASTAAMKALLFNPATETWSPAGTIAFPRMYHSTALLLPDGTVWLGGSNPAEGVWEPKMEIYKPPYLFTSTGAAAPRPSISSAPAVIGYGASFSIGTAQAATISQVVLVRPGSATHAFDMEQRLVHLQFTKGTGTLTATSPPGATVAPPGHYLLFVLDQNGVPSVAKFIRLSASPTNQPPVATITNPSSATVSITAGQSVTFAGSATDPDGGVAVYQWLFPGGAPGKSTVQNPGAVKYSNPGTYTASLTVLDDIGENNVSPPTVTVVVGAGAPTLPSVTIAAVAHANELGPASGSFSVTRTGSTASALTVKYTVSGSATPGSDYNALSGTVTIPAGVASATVSVTPVDDAAMEGLETVVVRLTSSAAYTVGAPSSATVKITSDETVRINATDPTATEVGLTTGTFTVTRTGSTASALTVNYTVAGTATAGMDYQALPGSVTIAAGATTATIVVTPLDDSLMEGLETVIVRLSTSATYRVGSPGSATVKIASDETVRISATDSTATEAGPTTGTFTVTRTGNLAASLTVQYTVTGTAMPGTDYTALSGSVTIPAGAATARIIVRPINDTLTEVAETVIVRLSPSATYTVGSPSSATVTIADND